ncbi:MAG: exodeoxyribonuclease VII large subunit, partial [bacterium]
MPEQINNIKVYSLLEVSNSIKKTITERYKRSFWVKAEMNRLNYYPQSGHCYPELVEKQNGKLVVNMRANLWKDDYQRINNKFIKVLYEPLKDYITILMNVTVSYETLYGLTLRIIDIDPAYTLGELEREKQETIGKLKHEGIFDNNKKLILPVLPKRIAIISVKTSKGFADFSEVINSKKGIYKFIGQLFPAILQGDNAVESIISQLNNIERISDNFDLVAIIRGGGGDVGLSCYNNYEFAKRVAMYPIPVLTGIGHSTNETVVEMVSNQNSITPTRLAEFLIEKFHSFSLNIQQFERIIWDEAKEIIQDEKLKIMNTTRLFNSVSKN